MLERVQDMAAAAVQHVGKIMASAMRTRPAAEAARMQTDVGVAGCVSGLIGVSMSAHNLGLLAPAAMSFCLLVLNLNCK